MVAFNLQPLTFTVDQQAAAIRPGHRGVALFWEEAKAVSAALTAG